MVKQTVTKQSLKKKEMQAKRYIQANILKQVGKQKLFELGIIPTILASIWFIPYWVGLLVSKAIGYDNYLRFINYMLHSASEITQEELTRGDFWFIGFFIMIILTLFILFNVTIAIGILKDKAEKKFGVSYYDLSDFRLRGKY